MYDWHILIEALICVRLKLAWRHENMAPDRRTKEPMEPLSLVPAGPGTVRVYDDSWTSALHANDGRAQTRSWSESVQASLLYLINVPCGFLVAMKLFCKYVLYTGILLFS